jgi:tetratricopeptide (TPR) repeat protein
MLLFRAALERSMAATIAGLIPVPKEHAVLMLESAYVLMSMKRFDEAREVLDGVAALLPKSEVPHLGLGTLELNLGRYDRALQEFRKAQNLAPKSGLPRAHAGEALLFLGKTRQALQELDVARQVEPNGDGARLADALAQAVEVGALPPPDGDAA